MNPYSSLSAWDKNGTFDKETKLYIRLSEIFARVVIFSYGSKDELIYAKKLPKNITIIPRSKHIHPLLYEIFLPFLHWRTFRMCDILKTNQNAGALAPSIVKILFPYKKFIVRSGYIGSEFARLSKLSRLARLYFFLIENISYRLCDTAFIPETDYTTLTQKYPFLQNKTTIISNGIDTTLFCRKNVPKTYDLVYPARLDNVQKNHILLLDAIKGLNLSLVCIGQGATKELLLQRAQEDGTRLTILDRVPNEELPNIYNSAKVCAFPSLFEGNPKALLECMSCAMPIVALDVPGVGNLLKHNESGLLSKPESTLFREDIQCLLADSALQQRCGDGARQFILKHYNLHTIFQKEITQYQTL